jgi:hypothetical protein
VLEISPQGREAHSAGVAGEGAKTNDLRSGVGLPGPVLARKILIWVFAAFAVGFSVGPIRNYLRGGTTKDYPLWYNTGALVRAGQSPYYKDEHGEFPFMYPPGAAGLLAMISPAGKLGMIAILVHRQLVGVVCLHRRADLSAGWFNSGTASFFVLGAELVLHCVCLGHVPGGTGGAVSFGVPDWDVHLPAASHLVGSGGIIGAGGGSERVSDFRDRLLGISPLLEGDGVCDCFPGDAVAVADFLPRAERGDRGFEDLEQRDGRHVYAGDDRPTKERSYTWQNGSLISVTNRWLRPVVADHDDGRPPIYLNVASLSFRQVNIVIGFEMLALCLLYVGVMPAAGRRTTWSDSLEAGMLLILIVLFSPLSFTYNNGWLMLPIASVIYFHFVPGAHQARADDGRGVAWVVHGSDVGGAAGAGVSAAARRREYFLGRYGDSGGVSVAAGVEPSSACRSCRGSIAGRN